MSLLECRNPCLEMAPAAAAATATTVIFDFDDTMIDCDSDCWVAASLGAGDLFDDLLRSTSSWNTASMKMIGELQAKGFAAADVADALKRAPISPSTISAIRFAHSSQCDLRILSDSNAFYISTVLRHHDILRCFSEIVTNPADVDAAGRLKVSSFLAAPSPPHGCPLCPANLCKGSVVEKIREAAEGRRHIYIGDGKGDYCAALRLGEGDLLMPRANYALHKLVLADRSAVKAGVHPWSDGEELEAALHQLITATTAVPPVVVIDKC